MKFLKKLRESRRWDREEAARRLDVKQQTYRAMEDSEKARWPVILVAVQKLYGLSDREMMDLIRDEAKTLPKYEPY